MHIPLYLKVEGLVTYDLGGVLDGLWTLSFGLSQFHGHDHWLVCEVALIYTAPTLECVIERLLDGSIRLIMN